MQPGRVLVIGGGIGGLTASIALGRQKFDVTVIERDPNWTVYGVGIIQQSNVLRAAQALGILDGYLAAGVGFDAVEIFIPSGQKVARVPGHPVAPGLPVMQGDADTDLAQYPDGAFDYVVLSRTLQAVERPREVLRQMLRIGTRALVSFPNFGHWQVRWRLLSTGRMPMTHTWARPW